MMRQRTIASIVAIALGVVCIAQGGWIHAKAWLAQRLIERAWNESRRTGERVPPWPWADTYPIARLTLSSHAEPLYVLAGASGAVLAFGPAHDASSVLPADPGNSVISAHRDTHFDFLRHARRGDVVTVERASGLVGRFRIEDMRVVDSTRTRITLDGDVPRLTLVTCYPFDAIAPGGPLRYVVTAEWVGTTAAARPVALARR
jgi:sortase A